MTREEAVKKAMAFLSGMESAHNDGRYAAVAAYALLAQGLPTELPQGVMECPKCGQPGVWSAMVPGMCTACANRERGV